MEPPQVSALRSVDLGVTDVAANAEFYSTIWRLEQVASENGSIYLRGTGPAHHILALHEARALAILKVTFQASDRPTVDALHARAKGLGVAGIDEPAPVQAPGGGYGFGFSDREGRVIRVVAGAVAVGVAGGVVAGAEVVGVAAAVAVGVVKRIQRAGVDVVTDPVAGVAVGAVSRRVHREGGPRGAQDAVRGYRHQDESQRER